MLTRGQQNILETLEEEGDMSSSELVEELGLHPDTVRKYTRVLRDRDKITTVPRVAGHGRPENVHIAGGEQ